jgi:hypothetical protein
MQSVFVGPYVSAIESTDRSRKGYYPQARQSRLTEGPSAGRSRGARGQHVIHQEKRLCGSERRRYACQIRPDPEAFTCIPRSFEAPEPRLRSSSRKTFDHLGNGPGSVNREFRGQQLRLVESSLASTGPRQGYRHENRRMPTHHPCCGRNHSPSHRFCQPPPPAVLEAVDHSDRMGIHRVGRESSRKLGWPFEAFRTPNALSG